MCEFKIIKKNDDSQIGEEVLVLSYSENNELMFKDILGMGGKLDSAVILDVNTISQTCIVFEHPLIKDFIGLLKSLNADKVTKEQINSFQTKLEEIKFSTN